MRKIKLPHAGEEFKHRTRIKTIERLQSLREIGYRVPEKAIKRLRAEIKLETS